MKELIKILLPPLIFILYKKVFNSTHGWSGEYFNWYEAEKNTTGYDAEDVFHKVKHSALKVKSGEAVFERDGVVFNHIQYSWPLLATLMYVALKNKGALRVLDFGGSLGSTYYQNKKFLSGLKEVSWNIVEQKHFVDEGNKNFSDNCLSFFNSAKECLNIQKPNVLLFSSVIQYLEHPYKTLNDILDYDFDVVFFDRTPFTVNKKSFITLQKVPEEIYKASYPCWIFNEVEFINFFSKKGYEVTSHFISPEGSNGDFCFKGMIMEKQSA